MKVKVQHFSGNITEEEVTPIFKCKHVEDTESYPSLSEVKFDETSEYIIVENPESCYGYSVLWLWDRKNRIYEWEGFGHSGASSVICALLQELNNKNKIITEYLKTIQGLNQTIDEMEQEMI